MPRYGKTRITIRMIQAGSTVQAHWVAESGRSGTLQVSLMRHPLAPISYLSPNSIDFEYFRTVHHDITFSILVEDNATLAHAEEAANRVIAMNMAAKCVSQAYLQSRRHAPLYLISEEGTDNN
ncbi:MAG: hypothetical protein [Trichoderma harzianum mononegavirus 1]|nr:MAG: hypothetical protein [Trichoderma harzianum mononegavirus 1]